MYRIWPFLFGLFQGHRVENASFEAPALFLYNASSKQAWKLSVAKKKLKAEGAWNPEGVSLLKTTLMAVNRAANGTSIEIFALNLEKKTMKHKKSVRDPLIYNVGDVAATGPKTFFFSCSFYSQNPTLKKVEWFLNTKHGFVGFYDGAKTRKEITGVSSPTGLLFDRSRKLLYVGSFLDQALLVYNADPEGKTSFRKRIDLVVAPLLFSFDAHFDLVLAAQPLKFKYFYYEQSPFDFFAPSTVLKVRYKKGKTRISQYYANDGATISGASVALKTDEELLLANSNSMVLSCKTTPALPR
uniref:Methylamine utilization protein MauE n=1 Tax=Steinernema glaseri TaxID=37863 RepID=A0A1I7YSX5_9BILA